MEWVEVADSVVKIGLTAIITSVASYLVLRKNHRHEVDKEIRTLNQVQTEERKLNYSQFLTHSLMLTQKYRDVNCDAKGSDYIEFLNIYNKIQITSSDPVRVCAFNLFNAVNVFIVIRKDEQDRELLRKMRKSIDTHTGKFQLIARDDLKQVEKF